MIKLTEDRRKVGGVALGGIAIGDSAAETNDTTTAILNVAQDLVPTRSWVHEIEYMHVGLIDGPGNEPLAYCAAVYALHALLKRHNVLVCCHTGGRALAVCLMYLVATGDRTWNEWLSLLDERCIEALPSINTIHKDMCPKILSLLKKGLV